MRAEESEDNESGGGGCCTEADVVRGAVEAPGAEFESGPGPADKEKEPPAPSLTPPPAAELRKLVFSNTMVCDGTPAPSYIPAGDEEKKGAAGSAEENCGV